MLNFSGWTPTLGVCFKWDSQKVLKIAHIGIFRHVGGVRWNRKVTDIKILWVKVLHAKMATFRPPGAEKLIFSDKTLPCSIDCAPKHTHSWTIKDTHMNILQWWDLQLKIAGTDNGCDRIPRPQSGSHLHQDKSHYQKGASPILNIY